MQDFGSTGVQHRFNRFHELTGNDIRHPESAALIAPALRARGHGLDMAEWLATDLEFHTAITRVAGNRIRELAMTSVHLVRPMTNTVFVGLLDRDVIQAQHSAVFEAIENQDPDLARTRLLEHVNHLADVRAQALAHRRASEVPISSLLSQDQPTDG
ncbi:FadR/GntR family transcriptional regulator [Streptomyces sp. NPDC001520]|uniref:FadR/GntR family transcriptional regulator n=1 Tax=Streptomyces sp. NPDC001520 TaxID=3364581 RepID=UPI0036C40DDE